MKRLLGLTLATLLFSLPAPAGFTKFNEFGARATIPVAWGDADNDGDADLAVGNFGQTNELYRNDAGTFAGRDEFSVFTSLSTFAVVWGDFDNDGDQDMAVGNGTAERNHLFMNNGDGTFTRRSRFGVLWTTIAMAWVDYNNDGNLDMAVGNGLLGVNEQNYLYVNNGDSTFTEVAQFGMHQTASLVSGDYDNDGDLDMAVGNGGFNFTGPNYLYRNDGGGNFAELSRFGSGNDTSCLVWGDYDNDGDLDMAVANWADGQNYLYRNDGADDFFEQPQFGVRDPNTMAWGDYDNDGDLDLAVGNGDFGSADTNFIYINNGDGTFTEQAEFGLGSTDGMAWGDYDDDGDLDMAVGNEHHPFQNWLYRNNQDDNASLRIHLIGHFHDSGAGYSNRDGVGARVSVYEAGHIGESAHLLGYREVAAHGGFASQNLVDAHFGLSGAATVDVRIVWPGSEGSRITQDLAGVATGQRLVVDETSPATSLPEADGTRASVLKFRISPNPTRGTTRFEILLPEPSSVPTVDIYNVSGRLVRTIGLSSAGPAGRFQAEWDLRAENGGIIKSGVYFALLRDGSNAAARRIVVVK